MKTASDILAALFDEATLQKAKGYSDLFSASSWEVITKNCGIAAASAHSRVSSIEHAILLIEADHPGWVQLLQTKQTELLNTARKQFPELEMRGISFMLFRA